MTEVKSSILDKLPPLQISSSSSPPQPTSSSSPSSTANGSSPSSSLFPADRSVWHSLLSRASRRHVGVSPVSTLIVLGDATSGKSSLLSKFSDRVSSSEGSEVHREYLLDYSYCNVKNRLNADKDEILSQMNIWQLDDSNHSGILHTFLRATRDREAPTANGGPSPPPMSPPGTAPTTATAGTGDKPPTPYSSHFSSSSDLASLESSLFVITVDVAEPWKAITNLNKWLAVLTKYRDYMWTKLSAADQKKLTDNVALEVQSYYNADLRAAMASKGQGTKSSEENSDAQLDPNVPQINLGLTVVIVGTKADSFSRHLQSKSGLNVDERMEFLVRHLRQVALQYGAALFFTSAARRGPGTNIEQLQSYIYHRIYNFPMIDIQPKAVATEDDFALYIPTGFDSKNLIDSIQSKFNDSTPFEEVFKSPTKAKSVKSVGTEAVKAQDNVLFFKNLKFSLESGVGPTIGLSSTRQTSGSILGAAKPTEQKTSATPTASAASLTSPSNGVPTPATVPPLSATTSSTATAAAAAAASLGTSSKMNPKGQQAVKQFFKNLLNSNPTGPATGDAAMDPKTVRANAEKELRKMTEH